MWIKGNNKKIGRVLDAPDFLGNSLKLHQFVQGIGISTTSAPRRVRMVQTFCWT